jgi:hypothetical protein
MNVVAVLVGGRGLAGDVVLPGYPWRTRWRAPLLRNRPVAYMNRVRHGYNWWDRDATGQQPPEVYVHLYATAFTCIRGIQAFCMPKIVLVGPEDTRTPASEAYDIYVRHRYGTIHGVQTSCTPPMRCPEQPKPTLPMLYGVRAFCTPRLWPQSWRTLFMYASAVELWRTEFCVRL